ncbi:HDIG domain-containing metalloprotein [Patulibacter sp. S7RM1-6]
MPQPISRDDAWTLLREWVHEESLRRHCLAVEASMRTQARAAGEDEELWGVTGLLHDADYERHPDLETGHPRMILAELERRDAPAAMRDAIAGHAPYLGVPRETPLARALFAVDELSGFVMAVAKVRPQGIHGLTAKSVRKKLRTASFAAAVDRDDIALGAEELGVEQDELIAQVVAALEPHAAALGIDGRPAAG